MIIGIDIDNTINNLTEAVLSVYNERHNTNYTINDIKTYCIEDNIDCNSDEIKTMFLDKEVWKRVKVIPDAVKCIKKLHKKGHEIYFISATLLDNVPKKAAWLRRNFPFLDIENCFIPVKNKKMIKIDVLVDDCVDNLRLKYYKGFKYSRDICFKQPWNSETDFICAKSNNWEEVLENINNRVG